MTDWFINIEILGAIASIIGFLIGVPAFVFAIVQLRRTETAAVAAVASVNVALQRLSAVLGVASVERICSRSRDLLHLLRTRNLTASATAALELRESVAKFSMSGIAIQILQEREWSKLLRSVAEVHDMLERAAAINKIDAGNLDQIFQTISSFHSRLSMLTTVAGEKAGGINANSR